MLSKSNFATIVLLALLLLKPFVWLNAQQITKGDSEIINFETPGNYLWLNNYGVFRIAEKFFVTGELHYRRTSYENIRYVGRMAQVYNRWGLQWNPSKKFSTTAGGVLRIDFTPDPKNDELRKVIFEPRIWHEYLFALPFNRFMVYHRLRFEHRWSTRHKTGSDWIFRNRYRYMFLMKIPINKPKLTPGAFYFSPNVELILHSGSNYFSSPIEDLRLYPAIGYIHSPRLSFSSGMMYTTGQRFDSEYYRTRWVMKINMYLSLDFRKFQDKIPEIRFD